MSLVQSLVLRGGEAVQSLAARAGTRGHALTECRKEREWSGEVKMRSMSKDSISRLLGLREATEQVINNKYYTFFLW